MAPPSRAGQPPVFVQWPADRPIEVNVHIQGFTDPRLDQILNLLSGLKAQGESNMALTSEAVEAVTDVQGKVASLIALVQALHDAVINIPHGLTPEQQADVDKVFSISKQEAADIQTALDANPVPTP